MGVQLGIPIVLCLVYEANVLSLLILLICPAAFIAHEVVAHYDVHYSAPRRHISIWEVHVHNYMATIPLYLLMLVAVINWEIVLKLLNFEWQGQFTLQPVDAPHGSDSYLRGYLTFMALLCGVPYLEENIRRYRAWRARGCDRVNAYVTSTGSFLPGPPTPNHAIEDVLGLVEGRRSRLKARILQAKVIQTRHYAIDREHRTTHPNEQMAVFAAQACMAASPLPTRQVGMLSCATTQGDLVIPGFGSMVQAGLGIPEVELHTAHGICSSSAMALRASVNAVRLGD